MTVNGILEKGLLDYGFSLEENEDFVDLKHNGKIIATWYGSAAIEESIRTCAWAWKRRHERQRVSGKKEGV